MGRLKVLFVSSEVAPLAKTGGLADVAGSLPKALKELGVDIRIAMPKYGFIKTESNETTIDNLKVYFVENKKLFNRPGLYGDRHGDYQDNLERFSFFSNQVLEMLKKINFTPDVIHCNDWQTALIPVYLKNLHGNDPLYKNIKTIFTIHNLAYQGVFPKGYFPKLNLSWDLFNIESLEFYDQVNLMKGGLVYSDLITTVSPTYSKEMLSPKYGCGLEGVLMRRRDDIVGILNGIDYKEWDPARNPHITKHYSARSIRNKRVNKENLQKECGLTPTQDVALVGMITRLAEQKGVDLLLDSIDSFMHKELQFVLLGTGNVKYHRLLEKAAKKYGHRVSVNLRFDAVLAQKIYAGCDIFMIPSRFEPCGLSQMISLRYGTIPVVRATGGLRDTIEEINLVTGKGNGFVFYKYSKEDFLDAIDRALRVYKDKEMWDKLTRSAMECDFSWKHFAKEYVALYKKVLAAR